MPDSLITKRALASFRAYLYAGFFPRAIIYALVEFIGGDVIQGFLDFATHFCCWFMSGALVRVPSEW